MSAIYGVHDPDEKLEMFDTMLFDCMERHVPLKGTKIIRPLTLWLKYQTGAVQLEERTIILILLQKIGNYSFICIILFFRKSQDSYVNIFIYIIALRLPKLY